MPDPNPDRIIRRLKRQRRRVERAYKVFIESMIDLHDLGAGINHLNTFNAGINRPLIRSYQNLSAAVSALERIYGESEDPDVTDDD